ncbi:MAG: alpha/beta fold hydrolase [Brevinema sp.]
MKLFKILIIILTLNRCTLDNSELEQSQKNREMYYVHSKKATLPVWIFGKKSNKVFLFVHGGPGLSGLVSERNEFIQILAKKYRVVLYDQRASGFSRGHPNINSITLDQHVEDLDAVVDIIMAKYPQSEIHLFGHSFGGLVSSAYASIYEDRIETLSLFSPLLSIARLTRILPNIMITKFIDPYLAREDISEQRRIEWENIREFYEENPILTLDTLFIHRIYATKAMQAFKFKTCVSYYKNDIPFVLKDPMFEIATLINQISHSIKNLAYNHEDERDLETDPVYSLSQITIPVLMVTADTDFVVPEEASIPGFNKIGSQTKTKITLKNAPHVSFLMYPVLSAKHVEEFIETN